MANCLGLKLVSIGFKTFKDLQHCFYNELFAVELHLNIIKEILFFLALPSGAAEMKTFLLDLRP